MDQNLLKQGIQAAARDRLSPEKLNCHTHTHTYTPQAKFPGGFSQSRNSWRCCRKCIPTVWALPSPGRGAAIPGHLTLASPCLSGQHASSRLCLSLVRIVFQLQLQPLSCWQRLGHLCL